MRLAVVKLGGSTAHEVERTVWITAFAASKLPLVIVPGGGPFAEQVRAAQKTMGFSDEAAHAMAILAMDQFGHVILDRDPRLAPVRSLEDIKNVLQKGGIPVWLPSAIALHASDIQASWDVTSDSLAAWLAGRIDADGLLLVKQSRDFSELDSKIELTARGILDQAFAAMLPNRIEFHLAGPQDAAGAAAILSEGRLPGMRVGALTGAGQIPEPVRYV